MDNQQSSKDQPFFTSDGGSISEKPEDNLDLSGAPGEANWGDGSTDASAKGTPNEVLRRLGKQATGQSDPESSKPDDTASEITTGSNTEITHGINQPTAPGPSDETLGEVIPLMPPTTPEDEGSPKKDPQSFYSYKKDMVTKDSSSAKAVKQQSSEILEGRGPEEFMKWVQQQRDDFQQKEAA